MSHSEVRAKLLIVANFRGWAWDHKARNLQRELYRFGIDVNVAYFYDYRCDPETGWHDIGYSPGRCLDFASYDAVLLFSLAMFPLVNDTLDMQRAFVGICSHVPYNGRPGVSKDVRLLNRFKGVFVLNRILLKEFQGEIENLYFCPNGVDTNLFTPIMPVGVRSKLVIGWVGDPSHACEKGFYDIIQPALSTGQYHLAVANKKQAYRSYQQMPDFYNSIDLYICASLTEGTPNPCLEAAACGRPILTTAVGNMPEFIQPGYNGFFIRRSASSLAHYLEYLDDNRYELRDMGTAARNIAIKWDWSRQCLAFVNMLSETVFVANVAKE